MTDLTPDGLRLGLERHVDIAVRLRSTRGAAAATSRSIGVILDQFPMVSSRLAGVSVSDGYLDLTIVVSLGSVEDVARSADHPREALTLLNRLVTDLADHQPSFTAIPDPASTEAETARLLLSRVDGQIDGAAVNWAVSVGVGS